jgi:glycosyltransferase involved in cell wall biosynthesis
MRVVLTCDWFLKYAAAQAAGLARAGAQVLLLCRSHALEFGGNQREWHAALDRAQRAGVEVLEIPGRISDPRAVPRLIALRRRVRRFAPDIVHAHDGADARALALTTGIPTVLTIHDPVAHPGQPRKALRKRWFLNGSRDAWRARAGTIIVHSDRLRREVELREGQRCAVIPHGLDVLPAPLPPPLEPAVAFFGRLEPYKGLDVLARAMPRVWEVRPDVALRVAGSGDCPVGLDDRRVHVERGYLPEASVEGFFRAASIAVLPYTQASQTGAGSVAIGYGVPLVVSRVGGLPDLALERGYVVEPGDDAALAAAILTHIDDDGAVRRRVHSELAQPRSWDSTARQTLELYRELISRTGSSHR